MPSLEANQLLLAAADACDSKKAEDIRILELDPSESALTDYFLICNGTNERQNAAIADEIEMRLKKDFGVYPNSVEGRRQGEWILMDYVDFVAHIFMPEKRAFYGLERLKKSAKVVHPEDLNAEVTKAVAALRSKSGTRRSGTAPGAKEVPTSTQTRQPKTIRKSTSKVAEALAKPAPKKSAGAKSATKKASVAKKASPVKKASKKSAVTKSVAKKAPAKKAAAGLSAKKSAKKAAGTSAAKKASAKGSRK